MRESCSVLEGKAAQIRSIWCTAPLLTGRLDAPLGRL
jgi:hypothetical protein